MGASGMHPELFPDSAVVDAAFDLGKVTHTE